MSDLSARAKLRLDLLKAVFHPTRSNDQLCEFVREFEKKLFNDIEIEAEGQGAEAPPPRQPRTPK